jgi:hypothetical protein
MASRFRIPVEHREHSAPPDILAKLPQAEADHRAAAVAEAHRTADLIGEPDVRAAAHKHADKMNAALPYREYQAQVKRLRDAIQNLPNSRDDLRIGYWQALDKLREDNPYPAQVDRTLDQAKVPAAKSAKKPARRVLKPGLVAKDPFTGWCPWPNCQQELLDSAEQWEHSERHQREDQAAAKKRLSKALAKAQTDLDRRVRELRAEIAQFKRERGIPQ